mmetsp:Transcript_11075/g.18957  ORF Transcript_11075/g.18957 Transcript_11075/m.18957 type:complete len:218 (-) Transcript_11075:813-1466(-)
MDQNRNQQAMMTTFPPPWPYIGTQHFKSYDLMPPRVVEASMSFPISETTTDDNTDDEHELQEISQGTVIRERLLSIVHQRHEKQHICTEPSCFMLANTEGRNWLGRRFRASRSQSLYARTRRRLDSNPIWNPRRYSDTSVHDSKRHVLAERPRHMRSRSGPSQLVSMAFPRLHRDENENENGNENEEENGLGNRSAGISLSTISSGSLRNILDGVCI